jgi:uncharacterized cupin superfamily protein
MSDPSFIVIPFDKVVMRDAPITPAWVRAGSPKARMGEIARSGDGTAVTVAWDCTAGLFEWRFGVDETVHIVDGEVTVADENGVERTLRAGDVAFFRVGSVTLWRVDAYVRKLAVCRHAMPKPLGFALRAYTKLKWFAGLGVGGGAMTVAPGSNPA